MQNKNLFYYISSVLLIAFPIILILVLGGHFEVIYCYDNIQEAIDTIKEEISKVQNELKLCKHDLESGGLTKEQYAEVAEYKEDLTNRRRHFMEYLGKFRELQNRYVGAEVVISDRK